MLCVTTRFKLKHVWQAPVFFLAFRRMRTELSTTSGIIRYGLFWETPTTCYTFSIWRREQDLAAFASTAVHVDAIRLAMRNCAAIWSGVWRSDAVSQVHHEWQGPDTWPQMVPHDQPYHMRPLPESEHAV
jgi:heme-degrading monooxygenase HmoA